jgi:predicted RNA binding protein YcfA (HicA-like mRNA interferase family)
MNRSSARIIKMLLEDGWEEMKQKSTSHRQFKHKIKPGKVTVPHPRKDLPPGTFNSILKQAQLK